MQKRNTGNLSEAESSRIREKVIPDFKQAAQVDDFGGMRQAEPATAVHKTPLLANRASILGFDFLLDQVQITRDIQFLFSQRRTDGRATQVFSGERGRHRVLQQCYFSWY